MNRFILLWILIATSACVGSSYAGEISKAEKLISQSTAMWGDIISSDDYAKIIKTCDVKAEVDAKAMEHLKKAVQLAKSDEEKLYAQYLLNYVESSAKATQKYREYAELMLNGDESGANIAALEANSYLEEAIAWKKRAAQLKPQ
jgi:hypothetical protein